MKSAYQILKFMTAPVWLPLWVLKKFGAVLAVLFLGTMLGGCASTPATFEKSPCACGFENLNVGNYGGQSHA